MDPAYFECGDIEPGAELGQTAPDDIARSDTRVGYDRLAVIARALAPYRHSRAASGLQDQLAATFASKGPSPTDTLLRRVADPTLSAERT